MTSRPPLLDRIHLDGLEVAPAQVLGGVRLVPLIRREVRPDLRLARRAYGEMATQVSLDGEMGAPGIRYASYVPHALVVSWSDDGSPVAAFGTRLDQAASRRDGKSDGCVRLVHRMARREDKGRLRILPLHLAMEGFLALYFGGPDVAWSEYSRRALSAGLDPRSEMSVTGHGIHGLEDALRVFEIHDRQVGVLVFVADALASAFVVSHPDDYALLHRSLLDDFYGEVLAQYGLHAREARMETGIDEARVSSLADLGRELGVMRAEWAAFHQHMAAGLLRRPIRAERMHRTGPFQLQRFVSDLVPAEENHIGEAIVRDGGQIEYLKTFRLSAAQTRRAFLLSKLASQNWNLDATAALLGHTRDELIQRLEKAGFGYLIADHVLQAARRRR